MGKGGGYMETTTILTGLFLAFRGWKNRIWTKKDYIARSDLSSGLRAIALGLLSILLFFGSDATAQQRQGNPREQKVFLKVNLEELSLDWSGDQGEGG